MKLGFSAGKLGAGAFSSQWLGLGAVTALSSLLPMGVAYAQNAADTGSGTYVELAPSAVEAKAVEDTGYVATQAQGITKSNVPLIENPQSVTVVTRKQMNAQDAQNLSEALRYTAGVNAEPFGADNRNDYIYIRGFNGR